MRNACAEIKAPLPFTVHVSTGEVWRVFAANSTQAVCMSLELSGPGARMVRVSMDSQW